MKLKKLFMILFIFNTVALLFVAAIINEYQKSTKKLQNAYNMQYKSLILADELRQSSDDLTRMARTYVLTGNDLFEKQYKMVLDIRNGNKKRPKNYNGIFWDFLTLNNNTIVFDGEKVSLRSLMKKANFPDTELNLLFTSQNESDDLTYLETKAMNAIKGIFQDEKGLYSIYKEPNFKLARELLHSNEYHKAKIRIMKPLDDFYKAFEKRTKKQVLEANTMVKKLEFEVNVAVLFSIFSFSLSFFIILFRIIYPLESLSRIMISLSKNNMDVELERNNYDDEVGDMIGAVEIFKNNTQKLITSETELTLAIRTARNANKAKSIFLARMSHELRTPLNAILGFASLLKKSMNATSIEKENLNTIRKSGEHLLTIINEILELSKIEAGKIEIVNKQFNLHETLKEIESIFMFRCEAKDLKFSINIDKELPIIIDADEQRLKQILINLLSNSLKFTQNGEIKLLIYEKLNKLFFEVHDSGIGIEEKDLKKIFEPFEQIKNNDLNKNGTGLGLSITKELITLMGGNIYIKSKVNKGSSFFFSIDIKKIKEEALIVKTKNKQIKGIKKSNDIKTILVVDDIKENRSLIVQILKQYNFKTLEASNGFEAIDMFKKEEIDLIFMDILMDKLDGIETIKIIRKEQKGLTIPIIAVSANVFEEDRTNALSNKASDFLTKPVKEKEILKVLEKYIGSELIYESNIKEDLTKKIEIDTKILKALNNACILMDNNKIEEILENKNLNKNFVLEIKEFQKEFKYLEISNMCQKLLNN